jgi:regulator of RNase E activity RraA
MPSGQQAWTTDEELFDLCRRELFTAVVGDVMDKLGLLRQFLPPRIQPLHPDQFLIGRAMPVLEADVFADGDAASHAGNPVMARPFGPMLAALDDLKPNEVYICTGASPRYALWGELMTTRARHLGAAGAVLDGYVRDTAGILGQRFPTFAYGSYAQDQGPRGKVIDFRSTIEIDGVRIAPDDIVLGDRDGVCIVPHAAAAEVFSLAVEKVRGEHLVREAIASGMSASDAFAKYGIM